MKICTPTVHTHAIKRHCFPSWASYSTMLRNRTWLENSLSKPQSPKGIRGIHTLPVTDATCLHVNLGHVWSTTFVVWHLYFSAQWTCTNKGYILSPPILSVISYRFEQTGVSVGYWGTWVVVWPWYLKSLHPLQVRGEYPNGRLLDKTDSVWNPPFGVRNFNNLFFIQKLKPSSGKDPNPPFIHTQHTKMRQVERTSLLRSSLPVKIYTF